MISALQTSIDRPIGPAERFRLRLAVRSLWVCATLLSLWSLVSFTRFYAIAFHPFVPFASPVHLIWIRGTLFALAALLATAALSPRIRAALVSPAGVFALPFAALLFVAAYRSQFGAFDGLYAIIIFEDGPVEFLSFAFFAASAAMMGLTAVRARHLVGLGFALLAAFLGFVAGEEVSWGQRMFGWATPDMLADMNMQRETNLHNIAGLEQIARHIGPFLVGAYGVVGWIPRRLIEGLAATRYRRLAPFALLFPPLRVVGYFLPLAVFSVVKWYQPEQFWFALRDEELWELFLATGFLIYAADCRSAVSRPGGLRQRVL